MASPIITFISLEFTILDPYTLSANKTKRLAYTSLLTDYIDRKCRLFFLQTLIYELVLIENGS